MPGIEIYAGENSQVFSASGVVKGAPGRLIRIIVVVAGSAGTLTLYDNTAASGPILYTVAGTDPIGTIYTPDTPAANGIYISLAPGQQVRAIWT